MNVSWKLRERSSQPDFVEMFADPFEAFPVKLVKPVVQRDRKHLQNAIDASRARLLEVKVLEERNK